MLKSTFKKDNLYYRSRSKELFVTNIKNLDIKNRYKIKKLINRRVVKIKDRDSKNKKSKIKYLVK